MRLGGIADKKYLIAIRPMVAKKKKNAVEGKELLRPRESVTGQA